MAVARVLIVEDDAITALDIQKTLEKLNYEVIGIKGSGEDTLKLLGKITPDIILMDIILKGELDGIETARLINIQKKIPIVYLTARYDDETIERSKSTNPYGFLLKPLNDRDLNSCLRMALYRFEAEAKLQESETVLEKTIKMNSVLFNLFSGLLLVINIKGIITSVNNSSAENEFPTTHFKGSEIRKVFPGKTGNKFMDLIEDVIANDTEKSFEHVIKVNEKKFLYETKFVKHNDNEALALFTKRTDDSVFEKALKETESKYHNLIKNSPISITRLLIKSNRYEFVNDEFEKQSGYTLNEFNSLTDDEYRRMIHPNDREMVMKRYNLWVKEGCKGVKNLTYRIINKNKETIWLDSFHYADIAGDGKVEAINQLYLNVNKQKQYEEILYESKQFVDAFFQQSMDGIFIAKIEPPVKWDKSTSSDKHLDHIIRNTRITRANKPLAEQFGITLEEVLNTGTESYYSEGIREAKKRWKEFLNKGHSHVNEYYSKPDGSKVYIEGDYYCLYDNLNNFSGYLGIQRDMTERKNSDEMIRLSEEKYRNFVEHSSEGIFRLEFKKEISVKLAADEQVELIRNNVFIAECNHVFAKMYDELPENIIGKNVSELKYQNPEGNGRILKFIMNDYNVTDDEVTEIDADGTVKYFVVNVSGVIVDHILTNIWGVQRDVTEKKKADEAIKKSLKEKDILLKEIHHRVKNNLQIVTSLLKLQAGYVKDEKIKQLFRESQNRVQSMSLIHQKLYQTKDLAHIDFKEYIETVTTHLQHSYGILEDRVKINIEVSRMNMSIDNAIPAGLIINELVSNSLKHAFPDNRSGNVFISAAFDEYSDEYWLLIRDNGIGLKDKIDLKNSASFGLKLVHTLVKQLDGMIEIVSKGGVEFRIHFKSADYKERNNMS